MESQLWTEGASPWPHEREALAFVRARFPSYEPYRAWTNVEFIADDGSVNEIDLLAVTPRGSYGGSGDTLRGRRDLLVGHLLESAGSRSWRRRSWSSRSALGVMVRPRQPHAARSRTAQTSDRQLDSPGSRPMTFARRRVSPKLRSMKLKTGCVASV